MALRRLSESEIWKSKGLLRLRSLESLGRLTHSRSELNAMASILVAMSKMYSQWGQMIADYKVAYARVAYLLQEQKREIEKQEKGEGSLGDRP